MAHTVPYQTVKTFTNRVSCLSRLAENLHAEDARRDPPRSVALWGRGGSGKSQLALRYFETHRSHYDPVLWIDAHNPNSALQSFSDAFEELNLEYPSELIDQLRKDPEPDRMDPASIGTNRIVKAVLNWLKNRGPHHTKWLVVIDNADDLSWVRQLIPRGNRGSVIITSRNKLVGTLVNEAIPVDRMTKNEAVELLSRSADLDGSWLNNTRGDTFQGDKQYENALAIANKLEYFPLAIDLAGYYISQAPSMQEDLSLFLEALERNPQRVLTTSRPENVDTYQLTVANVWELSFSAINRTNPTSANLLLLLSFFNPANIEDRLFAEASAGVSIANNDPVGWKQLLHFVLALLRPWNWCRWYWNWSRWYWNWWRLYLIWLLPQSLLPQCWLPRCWLLPVLAIMAVFFVYRKSPSLAQYRESIGWAVHPLSYFFLMSLILAVFRKWDEDYWDKITKPEQLQDSHAGTSFYLELGSYIIFILLWLSKILPSDTAGLRRHFEASIRRSTNYVSTSQIPDNLLVSVASGIIVAGVGLYISRSDLSSLRSYTPDIEFFKSSTVVKDLIWKSDIEEERKAHVEAISKFLKEEAQGANSHSYIWFLKWSLVISRVYVGFVFGVVAFVAFCLWLFKIGHLGGLFKVSPLNKVFPRDAESQRRTSRFEFILLLTVATIFGAVSYLALGVLWQEQDSPSSFFRLPPESPGLLKGLLASSEDGRWNSEPYMQALAPLLNHGLIQRTPSRGHSVHDLVQWWGRQRLDVAERQIWAMEGIRLVQYALQTESTRADIHFLRHVVNQLIEIASILTSDHNYLYADMRELMVSLILSLKYIDSLQ